MLFGDIFPKRTYCYRLKFERDLIVNMRYEKERLDTICTEEEKKMDKLKKVLDIVQRSVLFVVISRKEYTC